MKKRTLLVVLLTTFILPAIGCGKARSAQASCGSENGAGTTAAKQSPALPDADKRASPGIGAQQRFAPSDSGGRKAETVIVYITRTGKKYHSAGCRCLSKSRIPMPLVQAKQLYGPCSICNPPK